VNPALNAEPAERFRQGIDPQPPAAAFYQAARRFRRGRGWLLARQRLGCELQPGLALLRPAQGAAAVAGAGMGRVLGATADPLCRARLLPQIEIALAPATSRARTEQVAAVIGRGVPDPQAASSRRCLRALSLCRDTVPTPLCRACRHCFKCSQ